MRIRIIDADTNEVWLYNVKWDVVENSLKAYERIYMMDNDFLDRRAIDLAIHKFFGNDSTFYRDRNIRSYIFGKIKEAKRSYRHVFIFFED